ncbi:MAG: PTS sugar transporter subunit IIA, partial [Leuconostoc mesenteroides]
ANPVVTEHESGFEVDAPVSGHLIQLSDVPDNVFSTGMMGKGVAIEPSDGTIYAPADGEITVAYQTKHAYGL